MEWNDVSGVFFPRSNIMYIKEQHESSRGLINGSCNVIVGKQYQAP